jgi:hypothetical protein
MLAATEKCLKKALVNKPIEDILKNVDKCVDEHWTEREKM